MNHNSKSGQKTNAARLLDSLNIHYSLYQFDVNEEDLSATSAAIALNVSPEQVFKTLVVRGDRTGVLMACIPSASSLNLKRLSKVSANKSVNMVPLREVFPLTGYLRGGCSPLCTRKQYPVWIDETAQLYDQIYISAGKRGLQFLLSPDDLLEAASAVYADIADF